MPHYLIQASYSDQSISGLISSGEDRTAYLTSLFEGMGGKVESYYQCFGDYDAVLILELPDNVSMAATSMVAGASGAVRPQCCFQSVKGWRPPVKRRVSATVPLAARSSARQTTATRGPRLCAILLGS